MADLNQLSSRMRDTIASLMTKVDKTVSGRSTSIDLATAENWLLRPELQEIYGDAIQSGITSKNLSYPHGLGGDVELRESLAALFTKYFAPHRPVQPDHVVATPGATHCLDALLTTICNEGDGVLVPVPYWSGFDVHFQLRARVRVVPVRLAWAGGRFDETSRPLSRSLLPALAAAADGVPDGTAIRALVMTNPHNPFGQCYPARVLDECMAFCRQRRIHYISDELYAFSHFGGGGGHAFASALSRMPPPPPPIPRTNGSRKRLLPWANGDAAQTPPGKRTKRLDGGGAPSRTDHGRGGHEETEADPCDGEDAAMVHVIWSTSKDFGSSGLRMAALISQSPRAALVLKSVALLSSMHLSSLSSLATLRLLRSARLPELLLQLSSRLSRAHEMAAARFRRWGTQFFTVDAGPFVMVRLGERQKEGEILEKLARVGVMVAPGGSFGGPGWCDGDGGFWARITVAVLPETLWDGLQQMEWALGL